MALSETQTYDRCLKLLEFAQSHRIIFNTLDSLMKTMTSTWHSPDGIVPNQIDIHLQRCFKSSTNKAKTRTYPGTDRQRRWLCLDEQTLRTKRRSSTPSPQLALLLDKLQDPIVTAIFKAKVEGKFIALSLVDCNEDTLVENIKEVLLLLTTQEVLYRQSKSLWPQEGLGEKKGKPEAARTGLGASTGPQRRKRHCVASKKPTNYWRSQNLINDRRR